MAVQRGRGRGVIPGLFVLGLLDGAAIVPTNIRVTQLGVEVVELSGDTQLRVSQLPVEVVELSGDTQLRVSQVVIEVIYPFTCSGVAVPPDNPFYVHACPPIDQEVAEDFEG